MLVGDAYSTSCPAAGTGANKVLTDVQRLCSTYVPAWLGKETIEAADVADFYADPVKVQCESDSLQKALWLHRVSTGTSWACAPGAGRVLWRNQRSGGCAASSIWTSAGKDATDVLRGA